MSFPRILYAQIAREEGHSEEFIAETLAYAEQLEAKNIQVIFSTLHLSMLVGVKYSLIQKILNDRKAYYENYEIKKRKGGTRQISSPHGALKKIQLWIYEKILSTLPLSENAFGFCPKKSIADNARVHVGQDFILNIDLLTFFDSIPEKRVYGIFKSLGYHTNLAVDLAKLCTCHPNNGFLNISDSEFISVLDTEHIDIFDDKVEKKIIYFDNKPVLPQGAPTSPSLSNIIACRLDKRLFGYAKKNNLKYSRYVDDITFSGKGECTIKLSVISKIIKE